MKKLATFAAVLFLVGCASTSGSKMPTGDFDSLVKEAEASIKKAASAGGEWRDSGKFLEKAKKAATDGDMKKAMKLVQQAQEEGELAYNQASSQKNAGPWLF